MDGVEQGLEPAVRHLKAQELRSTYSRRSPRYSIVLRVELRVIVRHAFAVVVPFYHQKLGPRTTRLRLNLVTNRLLISSLVPRPTNRPGNEASLYRDPIPLTFLMTGTVHVHVYSSILKVHVCMIEIYMYVHVASVFSTTGKYSQRM